MALSHFKMNAGDIKLFAFIGGNITLNGITLFIQKALPILSFVLVVLQIIAALYAVLHILKKRKNANKLPPPGPDI